MISIGFPYPLAMLPPIPRPDMSAAERDLRSQAAHLLRNVGLLHGNLIERDMICGKPGCRCSRGERHHVLHLHRRVGGRLRQLYVPRYIEAEVRRWVEQEHHLRELLARLWDLQWEKVRAMKKRR